jgi:hypothetical protein
MSGRESEKTDSRSLEIRNAVPAVEVLSHGHGTFHALGPAQSALASSLFLFSLVQVEAPSYQSHRGKIYAPRLYRNRGLSPLLDSDSGNTVKECGIWRDIFSQ